jgi:hypothetical protein
MPEILPDISDVADSSKFYDAVATQYFEHVGELDWTFHNALIEMANELLAGGHITVRVGNKNRAHYCLLGRACPFADREDTVDVTKT